MEDSDLDAESEENESDKEDDSDNSEANDSDEDKKFNRPPPPQDVQEGRTVFLKGVPFTATQEELKSCMNKFGPVVYALICTDPVTEHSRGSAFIKFQVIIIILFN
jgi:nucleolar protein 4